MAKSSSKLVPRMFRIAQQDFKWLKQKASKKGIPTTEFLRRIVNDARENDKR